MNILIAVTGGIAAYKIPSVVSALVDKGYSVKVMMTDAAMKFITPLTFSALSHHPVYLDQDQFAHDGHIHHIELAEWADTIAIAPATFNTISKIEQRFADNLVTSTIAATSSDKSILIFPAMNVIMWENLCLSGKNINTMKDRRITIFNPAEGKQACGAIGPGKLMDTRTIVELIEKHT